MAHRPLIALRPLRRDAAPAPVTAEVAVGPTRTPRTDRAEVRREITAMLADVLYLDAAQIDPDAPFQDLGIDSILGVEFIRSVQHRFAVPVNSTVLYEHSTAAAFADHVASALDSGASPADETPHAPAPPAQPALSQADVIHTLRERLAGVLYCEASDIDPSADFTSLGLDSVLGVEFIGYVNDVYGIAARAGVLYERPSLQDLAAWVVEEHAALTGSAPTVPASSATDRPATDLGRILAGVLDEGMSAAEAAEHLGTRTAATTGQKGVLA